MAATTVARSTAEWHAPLDPETKETVEFGVPVLLRRIPCSCGWAGCWYARPENAWQSWKRHVARRKF